jgi:DNA helicase HerA-like ATPase
MTSEAGIFVGGGGGGGGGGDSHHLPQRLLLGLANRHGLIAGATGTGKTVTLQILAEGFSAAGVPVFLSDVKGDLSGIGLPGSADHKLHGAFTARAETIGLDLHYTSFPVTFWDLFGKQGHPVRTTVAEMGPLLLSRLLELTEPQEGVMNVAFRLADDEGLPMYDLKDLRAMLTFIAEHAADVSARYGLVSTSSVGAIQRRLLVLENQGGAHLFGEPALALSDMMLVDKDGRGRINILAADQLMGAPRLYATFLLWLLSELFEELPEIGNPEKPILVFFFDEAHLLFDGAPKVLVDKVEQVVRLIRSKGVGIYFITQKPADVPDDVLAQLGNRVQHALLVFTPRDQKDLALAAQTYRENPKFSTEDAIKQVGTGEAVTSFLDAKGVPGVVERTLIRPPSSQLGPIDTGARAMLMAASPVAGKYEAVVDRDSAYERLAARAEAAAMAAAQAEADDARAAQTAREAPRAFTAARRYGGKVASKPAKRGGRSDSVGDAFAKSFARQLGSRSGQALVRGILGSFFKKR